MTDSDFYYRLHIFCCINERAAGHPRGSCMEGGGGKLQSYMKSRAKELGVTDIRVNKCGCMDRCEEGPVMVVYPDGIWYRARTFDDVDEILKSHIIGGQVVERLKI